MDPIPSHYEVTLQLVMQQYKNSPKFLSVLQATGMQADELEQTLWDLRDQFYLNTAVGAQLDVIGSIFGEARVGRSDADYRDAIRAKASRQYSGTPEDIISALTSFYGATYVIYSRSGIAEFTVETDGVFTDAQLEQLAPAGVAAFAITPDREFLLTIDPADPLALMDGGYLYLVGG